jgi:transcriptional regulator with XRE-family HTH domain
MKKVTAKTINSFRQVLGNMIRERRDAQGVTQVELADAIGSTQNRIPDIESGRTKNIDTYIACITILGGQLSITWK